MAGYSDFNSVSRLRFVCANRLKMAASGALRSVFLHGVSVMKNRAILLLRYAFAEGTRWAADFERITRFMVPSVTDVGHDSLAGLQDMDFFKRTALYVRTNNNFVFFFALIEVALWNSVRWLRRLGRARVMSTALFGLIALASPVISRLSESYGQF